jgi:outer membrane receptor for ferrienterochelin and colicins
MRHQLVENTLTFCILSSIFAALQVQAADNFEDSPTQLDTIVVTASGSDVDIKNAPASISVITQADIEKQPVASVSQLLANIPGVSGGQGLNAEGTKIKLRGLPSEYLLILVDGKRIGNSSRVAYRTDLQRQDLDWLTLDSIERIEVVKGPMSSLYGSDAMGGVINIITKAIPDKWSGSATINYKAPTDSDEGVTKQIGATGAGALTDSLGLRLSAGRTEREADENIATGEQSQSTSGMQNDTVSTSLLWKINPAHKLEFFGSYAKQTSTSPIYADSSDTAEFWLGGPGVEDETENQRYGLTWDGDYSWGGKSSLSAYQTKYDKSTSDTDQESTQSVLDAKLNLPFKLWFNHDLTLGGQWKRDELTNSRTLGINSNGAPSVDGEDHSGNTEVEADSWALFLEDIITLNDQFNVTIGGRLDDDERFDSHFSPRIYGIYHATSQLSIKGGVSTAFRAPDLVQTAAAFSTGSRGNGCNSSFGAYNATTNPDGFRNSNGTTGYVNCYTTGNPDLEPEESTNYEIGLSFNNHLLDGNLTYFYTDFKDKIVNKPYKHIANSEIDATYQSRYPYGVYYISPVNIESAKTEGLEGSFNIALGKDFVWKNSATYIIASENKDTGAALIDTPELSWYSSLLVKAYEPLDLELNLQYIGKQYVTDSETAPDAYLDPYWLLGISANYHFNDHLTFRAGVSNLLNEEVSASDASDDYYTIEGRALFIGLTAKF